MLDCPSDETLARLGHDTLDVAQRIAVEEHVQHCEKCVRVLEKLLSHGTATAPESASLPAEEDLPRIAGFEIEGEIGRGGMGVVYRAWEPKLARTVALKIVRSGPMTGSRERKRWLSEARCGTRVCHPNVVQIHGADEADGWLYLVLEFVSGGSLKDRLGGPVSARAAAELMIPVAAAVTAVHAAGLLHFDLKPSNILLDSPIDAAWKDACPKVADFGIARTLAEPGTLSTSMAGPLGTPSYMAPEQIAADRAALGPAIDVYALGAILYELLTGRPPFQGPSALETLDQIRGQQPVPPRRLNPKIPRDLETIALKCLEKVPSRRYASAEAMADDLRRWIDGRPIQARPVSPIEHAARWCRRQPVIAALAATLFVMVTGSILGLLSLLRRSEALRAHSEANYQIASRSIDELIKVFGDGEYGSRSGQTIDPNDQRWHAVEVTRLQEIELSKRNPLDLRGLWQLAVIDDILAGFYIQNGKRDMACSLIEEAIGCWDACLALAPDDSEVRRRLLEQTGNMLTLLVYQENDHRYERCNARAISILERLKSPQEDRVRVMALLSRCHRLHADGLMSRGESHRARKLLEEDLRLLRSVPVGETAFPEFALSEALTLARLGQWSGEITLSPSYTRSKRAPIDNSSDAGVADLTASRIGRLPSIVNPPSRIPDDLPAEAWADRVISSIRSDAAKLDFDDTRIPTIAWLVCRNRTGEKAADERRAGKLSEARRTVDRIHALAKLIVARYPDHPAAHLCLTEAFVQRAKNAWQIEDRVEVERNWRLVIDEARNALRLDPGDTWADGLLKEFQRRLNALLATQREAQAQGRFIQSALKTRL